MTQIARQRTVLVDHDGGVDDFLALTMLLAMPHIEVAGVNVTPGDCFQEPAVSATRKMLRMFGRSDVAVSAEPLPVVHPFLDAWRATSNPIGDFPILNEREDALPALDPEPGHRFLARVLREAQAPITVLATGPATSLGTALAEAPELAAKIDEVVWMGGAIDVAGNVQAEGHDGTAEWNAYCNPPAALLLWESKAPITLVSLDATNQVKFGADFLHKLAQQRSHRLSDLAEQMLVLTVGNTPLEQYTSYMWDALAAGYLGAPQLMTYREVRTTVIPDGQSAGRTMRQDTEGRLIRAVDKVDSDAFLDYILDLLQK